MSVSATVIRRVGVIGAGRMGQPIIGHMVRRGLAVTAYDVESSRRERVLALGATWADTADALARTGDAILICVGYDHQLRELMSDAFLKRLPRGTLVAVLSTVLPRTVQELAERAGPLGVDLIDATLCRGGRAADEGTLLSFVGGEPDLVERLTPVLACFCADIVHSGGVGSAQVAKSANNLIMWACLIADHEALALATRYGVDLEMLREALLKTGAQNGVLRNWGTSTMAWADDDLEIVQRMAQEVGVGLPQVKLNKEICRTLKPKKFKLDQYGV